MVYFPYLRKEYGLAKLGVVVLGTVIVGLGCHSYFNSPWVSKDVHRICDLLDSDPTITLTSTCPNILVEKIFIVVTLFCFTLSTLGLLGNLFSKQLSKGFFKLAVREKVVPEDIGFNAFSGILIIASGSLFLYSGVTIEALFTEIGEMEDSIPCIANLKNVTYQLYEEKVTAGALSIAQGLVYEIVAVFLFIR